MTVVLCLTRCSHEKVLEASELEARTRPIDRDAAAWGTYHEAMDDNLMSDGPIPHLCGLHTMRDGDCEVCWLATK